MRGRKSTTYEKVNPSLSRGTTSCFSEMRHSGWKCGCRLVGGKGSEPATGVLVPPLTFVFVVCDLDMSLHLTLGLTLLFFIHHMLCVQPCARLREYRPGPALPELTA